MALLFNIKGSFALVPLFWLKITISIIKHLLFALAWQPFYLKYHSIHGWCYEHQLLMIGLVTIGSGLVEIFFDGLRDLAHIIENRKLDIYLLKPQDPILLLALSKTSITSWSNVLAGILLIKFSHLFDCAVLLFIPLSGLFFFSLYLYLGSLRFFIPNSTSLICDLYSKAMLIATQPNVSYRGFLKLITFSILPVCLVSFYPIQYVREKKILYFAIVALGCALFYIFARVIFFQGLKRYSK